MLSFDEIQTIQDTTITGWDFKFVMKVAKKAKDNITIMDRKQRFIVFKDVFLGQDLIMFLVDKNIVIDPK